MAVTYPALPTYILYPDGIVEHVLPEHGYWEGRRHVPGLYDQLVLAGYPLYTEPAGSVRTVLEYVVYLTLDPAGGVVCTGGHESQEHHMGGASKVFLSWYQTREMT